MLRQIFLEVTATLPRYTNCAGTMNSLAFYFLSIFLYFEVRIFIFFQYIVSFFWCIHIFFLNQVSIIYCWAKDQPAVTWVLFSDHFSPLELTTALLIDLIPFIPFTSPAQPCPKLSLGRHVLHSSESSAHGVLCRPVFLGGICSSDSSGSLWANRELA